VPVLARPGLLAMATEDYPVFALDRIVGGTGTDGAPIITGIAKFMDILTIGPVTTPLSCNTKLQ